MTMKLKLSKHYHAVAKFWHPERQDELLFERTVAIEFDLHTIWHRVQTCLFGDPMLENIRAINLDKQHVGVYQAFLSVAVVECEGEPTRSCFGFPIWSA